MNWYHYHPGSQTSNLELLLNTFPNSPHPLSVFYQVLSPLKCVCIFPLLTISLTIISTFCLLYFSCLLTCLLQLLWPSSDPPYCRQNSLLKCSFSQGKPPTPILTPSLRHFNGFFLILTCEQKYLCELYIRATIYFLV